jgi:hypothetical protein
MTDQHEVHLPPPSIWPAVLGAGISLAAFGVPTSPFFIVFGVVLVAWGLVGWVEVLRHG